MSTPPVPPDPPPAPSDQGPAPASQPSGGGEASRKSEHRWLWALTAVLLVLAVVVGVIASENQEAKRTAEEARNAAQAAGEQDTGHNTVNLELNVQHEEPSSAAPEEETKEGTTTKEGANPPDRAQTRTRSAATETSAAP